MCIQFLSAQHALQFIYSIIMKLYSIKVSVLKIIVLLLLLQHGDYFAQSKVLPTNLELTYYWQHVPWLEKQGQKI